MEEAADALCCSILENTQALVQIHLMEAWSEPEWSDWAGQSDYRTESMRSGRGFWVTPFSLFRYAIPHCAQSDFAIYLDADMICVGDIAELWEYRTEGRWVTAENQDGDCVSVIDCRIGDRGCYPSFDDLRAGKYNKHQLRGKVRKFFKPAIPAAWNCHDYYDGRSQLVHYTSIKTQPWMPWPEVVNYEPHPDAPAVALWHEWADRAIQWQLKSA